MTIYNFSAGPAVLPKEVLQQAQAELIDWHGSGMSVMEMSHRGKEYMGIQAQAEADLRELMGIPVNYKVLFLQGGASLQFSMVPLNLLRGKLSADYVNTGEWSKKAISEAKKFSYVNVVASSADKNFSYVPAFDTWKLDKDAAYVHYTPNETIGGVEFNWVPDVGNVPLVADMSSCILSRSVDVSKFGLIYAGAQKNIGPAGLTIVIVRDDLVGLAPSGLPALLDYKTYADNDSMYNTPANLWHLHRRSGIPDAEAQGRHSRDGKDQYRQGQTALRRDRCQQRLLPLPGGDIGPFAHECAVHAERCES